MRSSNSFQWCTLLLLIFSTFATAWPWPDRMPAIGGLVARQDDNEDNTSSATSSSRPTSTSNSKSDSDSDSDTKPSSNRTSSANASKTSFDARKPVGGVAMQTPTIFAGPQYYKIGGDPITFGWNYTSLLAEPSAIDVFASCSINSELYTITANASFSKETQQVVWDTAEYQDENKGDPLLTEMYTLIIKDSGNKMTDVVGAGYLGTYNSYQFGMYYPQSYTPLGSYQCATCSGAISDLERQALKMVLGVCVITVASFTWFVGGTRVLW